MIDLLFYILIIVLIFYFDNKLMGEKLVDNLKSKESVLKVIFSSVFFSFVTLLMYYLLTYFDIIKLSVNIDFKLNFKLISYILVTVLVSPFIEEYIFRYVPYKIFKNTNYLYASLFISSLVFTFVHKVNVLEYVLVFISSISFSVMMVKTEKFIYSFISHALYNLCMVLCYFFYIKHVLVALLCVLIALGLLLIKRVSSH